MQINYYDNSAIKWLDSNGVLWMVPTIPWFLFYQKGVT